MVHPGWLTSIGALVLSDLKYADGQEVRLGDRVKLGQDDGGVVVASIDTNEYSGKHSEAQWGYLKKGVMIEFPLHGLIRRLPLHGRSIERKPITRFASQVRSHPYIRPVYVRTIVALASIETAGRNLIRQSALMCLGSLQDLPAPV